MVLLTSDELIAEGSSIIYSKASLSTCRETSLVLVEGEVEYLVLLFIRRLNYL